MKLREPRSPAPAREPARTSGRPAEHAMLDLQRTLGNRATRAAAGGPLPHGLQLKFERSLGRGLGDVRVHRDEASAEAARALHADAFTVGHDIFFARDRFAPDTAAGERLIAHEVAHAAQQPAGPHDLAAASPSGAAHELDADRAAGAMVAGESAAVSPGPAMLACAPEGSTFVSVGGRAAEDRQGNIREIDRLRALFVDTERDHVTSRSNGQLVATAIALDAKLWAATVEVGPYEKAAIARTLRAIYRTLDERVTAAPIGPNGLPVVEGIHWDETSPLAGAVIDIAPFGDIDLWATFQTPTETPPPRKPRRRKKKTRVDRVTFDDDVITVDGNTPEDVVEHDDPSERLREEEEKSERRREIVEGTGTVSHIGGGVVELIGEEALGLGATGGALEIFGVLIDYVNALKAADELRFQGGKREGWIWTLYAANELDGKGQGDAIDTDDFYKRIEAYRPTSANARTTEVAQNRLGAALSLDPGRAEGIEEAVRDIRRVRSETAARYNYVMSQQLARPAPGPGYELRLSQWQQLRARYAKYGYHFENPTIERQRLQHLALRRYLREVGPAFGKASSGRRE